MDFYNENDINHNLITQITVVARFKEKWIIANDKHENSFKLIKFTLSDCQNSADALDGVAETLFKDYTHADKFDFSTVYIYSHCPEGSDKSYYGKLFFADVKEIDTDSKLFADGELTLKDTLPRNLTQPYEDTKLFERVQWWRNSFGVEQELWDIYDENRNLTGKTHKRGDLMQDGDYHLVVHIVIRNSKGEYLVTKRAPNKAFPNTWEFTGGSAIMGDDSISAAMREVREETGFILAPENGKLVMSRRYPDCFSDMWLFEQDFDISRVVLQEKETTDAKFVDRAGLIKLMDDEIFSTYDFLGELLNLI